MASIPPSFLACRKHPHRALQRSQSSPHEYISWNLAQPWDRECPLYLPKVKGSYVINTLQHSNLSKPLDTFSTVYRESSNITVVFSLN